MLMKKILSFFAATFVMLAFTNLLSARGLTVKGEITDESTGEPVPFASVMVKGTMNGVSSNGNGLYSIYTSESDTLVFSAIGYKDLVVPIKGRAAINVSLSTDTQTLDETIVVAFGTSTKEAFTGSATVVKSSDISKVQSSNATRSIEGLVAGVQMNTATGTLGGKAPTIRVRGFGSISAGQSPLFVIDGIPYSGDMDNINPNDIESLTVLKDAASNSLYGSRGANGVIMITTKRAKSGEAVVNFDAKWGVNTKALQDYDCIRDPGQYYETHYASLYNFYRLEKGFDRSDAHIKAAANAFGPIDKNGLGYNVFSLPKGHENESLIGRNGKLNPLATLGRVVKYDGKEYLITPDDWIKEAYKSSLRQEYNVSVSGRTGKASFYSSFGYLNNNGIILGNDMKRYTARLKADYQAKSWLKVGGNMGYTNLFFNNGNGDEGNDASSGNIFAEIASVAPVYPLYLRDGKGNILRDSYGLDMYDYGDGRNAGLMRAVLSSSNAIQSSLLDLHRSEGNAFNSTGFVEIRFLKDFKFSFNAGVGFDETRHKEYRNKYYGQFAVNKGVLTVEHSRVFYLNLQQILEWNKTFAGKNHFSAMVGHENYSRTEVRLSASKKNLFSPDNLELDGAVVDGKDALSLRKRYNTEGFFSRVLYDYDSKFFGSLSYRLDASSRFSKQNWWGNFWSAGFGWLVNKEPWFNVNWINMLKFKTSIGSQGNDSIGDYRFTDTYELSNNEGEIALKFKDKGNKDITWETNTNFNLGADFELFNNRISGSIEYFYRKTSDMLFFFKVPTSKGYDGYYSNIGDMRNSGVELGLNFVAVNNKNFRWDINFNATHYSNKIIRLPEDKKTINIEGYRGFVTGNKFIGEGLSLYTFNIRKFAGIDHKDGKAMWYKDLKEDKNDKDKVTGRTTTKEYSKASTYLCDNPIPFMYGGFGTSMEFFGFDLSVQFTYSLGGKVYDYGYARLVGSPATPGYAYHKDVLKAWTPENPDSDFPRFVYNDKNFADESDRFLVNASYLNIKNAQIGYTLPEKLVRKINLSKVRVYATCDNIWYLSCRQGLDPRYSFNGEANNAHNSPVRTISGGINITF